MPVLGESSVTEEDLVGLGTECLGLLGEAFAACVAAGVSTSTEPGTDTVALWLGLHGLAHQRAATRIFPGPPGIDDRMVTTLARLRENP